MSKGDADIEMNFKVGNAAAANAIVRSVYQNQQSMMRSTQRQSDMLSMNLRKIGRSMIFGAAGYLGVGAISSVFSSVSQGINQVINKRAELEKAITPLASLEDNAKKLIPIRREVLGTSVAMGRSLEEVGRFYSDLVGSTGNLSGAQRDQLVKETKELAELTGGDLVSAQNMLTKSYQIYGKELVNVNQLQNKLMMTQDEGSIEFEDMALRLPELLQAGKVAGLSIDDVLGTVIGATRKSGSIEKTMTGLRNMFLIMEEAPERGVKLNGTYLEQIRQLQALFQTNAPKMQEMFGREVIVHASSVTDAFGDISAAVANLGKVMADTDSVAEKLGSKFKDPTYFAYRDMENIDRVIEESGNLFPEISQDNWLMRAHKRGKLGAAAMSAGTGGLLGTVAYGAGYLVGLDGGPTSEAGGEIVASTRDGAFFKETMRQKFEEKKAADLERIDNAMRLIPGASSNPEMIAERERRANLMPSPHLMTSSEYAAYRGQSAPSGGGFDTSGLEDAVRENTRALRERQEVNPSQVKPGGARTNYEETL